MSELYQHRARKCFGQNSLHDAGVIHHILRAIHARGDQRLLETGPGQDALTEGLLGNGARLDVIELDQDPIPLLKLGFGLESRFSLHQDDVLKFNLVSLVESGEKLRVVGNLSYNTSTPLIFHLLGHAPVTEDMCFMLQKEVVERLMATSGGGGWGRLPVMVQYHCRVERLFNVSPGAFNLSSKADSAIVRLTLPAEPPHPVRDPKLLERVAREVFNQRHKTLRNTLRPLLSAEDIEAAEVDLTPRPEQLGLAAFARLANRLAELPGNHQSDETFVRNQVSRMSDTQHQVNVRVDIRYPPEQSASEQDRFASVYMMTIENQGEIPVQLLSCHWIITDGDGCTQEARGAGVVGKQPLIIPGAQHTYINGTVLATRVDSMRGGYQILGSDGIAFDTVIPVFRLAVSEALH